MRPPAQSADRCSASLPALALLAPVGTAQAPRIGVVFSRCLFLVVLVLGCEAGPQSDTPSIRRIFLITVDTLRADHLGAYGYERDTSPYLDELAASGVLFERAIAQWPKTGASFVSMFTGQYPQTTGLTHRAAIQVPDGYLTLPEFLRAEGFTTLAATSNAVLAARLGWSDGFDDYVEVWQGEGFSDDPVAYRKVMHAGRVNDLALPLLRRHADSPRLFAWLHYSDPHAPYILPEGYTNPFLGDQTFEEASEALVDLQARHGELIDGERELRYYVSQYDANIRVVDAAIRALMEELKALDLLSNSLLIFTADHGESLGEHRLFFEHGQLPYNLGSHVPLFVVAPGLVTGGRRVARPVELVDLYPTIRDLVAPGREVPDLEGRSLLPFLDEAESAPVREAFRFAFAEAGGQWPLRHYRSVQDERWKLIYHPAVARGRRPRAERWELYDLEKDPAETRNLYAEGDRESRRLQRVLSDWMKGNAWLRRSPETVEEKSDETMRALRALGYVQ